MILPASYASGFAPRDGRPLYPELWRGCVGAWNPGLGPSGLTLRDHSGYGNHGTLVNMTANTCWGVEKNGYVLDFDGSNDRVNATVAGLSSSFSVAFWFRNKRIGTGEQFIFSRGSLFNQNGFWFWATNSLNLYSLLISSSTNNYQTRTIPNTDTLYHHVAACFSEATQTTDCYFDGRFVFTLPAITGGSPTSSAITLAKEPSGYQNINGNMTDIRLYNRALSPNEVALLVTCPGIAYELAPRRRSSSAVQFNRRRRLLLGVSN